jgi:trimethylamine:corrinoid methyltransferase-like protein
MSLRIARGLTVNEDTIARDLIESIGPQGEMYLATEHTLRWLRSDEHLAPRLSVRGPGAAWEAAGAKDTYQLARDAVAASAGRPGAPLETERRARLAEIIAGF